MPLTTEQRLELEQAARQAVQHLVEEAGICTAKDAFDYVGLRDALNTAKTMAAMQRAGAGVDGPARRKKLESVKKTAERLKEDLFGSDDETTSWVRRNAFLTGKSAGSNRYPIDLNDILDQMITRCTGLIAESQTRIFDHDETSKWLVGVELPSIYETFFGRKAAISRDPRSPSRIHGPYVRFGMAAMAYLGEACTIASFDTYWKRRRTFKPFPNGDSETPKNC